MARLPKVKLRAIPVFPSNVTGDIGVAIAKANGAFTITLDVSAFHIANVLPADTGTTYAISFGGVTTENPKGAYSLTPFSGFQGVSSDLTSLAQLNTFGIVARIGDADYATRTITAGTGIGVTNGGGIAGNPTVAITDAELLALAGLTSAADRLPYFTGSGTASLATFSAFARTLVDDADAATARATLGLTSPSTATPAALTKTDDTNVTLTLGGTPTTALLQATSITVGWTGTLAVSRGGTGISAFGTGVATALGVNVGTAGSFIVNGGALGTPASGVATNLTGTASGLTAGNVTTNANLTGDVTSVGNASTLAAGNAGNLNSGTLLAARMPALTGEATTSAGAVAVTLTNSAVIGKVLTGYTSGAGTVAATDTILQAIQKLNANDATNANLTGDVTSVGNATTLAAGSASNLNSGTLLAARMPALTGDITTSAGAVATAIGATKVTSAMLNADVFSTAHSWSGGQTFAAPNLGTPASGVATNLTGTAASLTAGNVTTNANLTGHVTSVGNAAVLGSFSTAQLNAALNDNDVATLAGSEELTNKTLNASVAKGTWTASGSWTIPAVTLGGTVSGGGNQINNVIIGSSTPLAGTFTNVTITGSPTSTPSIDCSTSTISIAASSNSAALALGRGLVTVTETTSTGESAVFLVSDGVAVLVAQTGTSWSVTSTPAAVKFGLIYSTGFKIFNGSGATRIFVVNTQKNG